MHGLFDIHCHLIPYVDDGARNMEEAVRMLKMEYSQGVRYIIVTPHYRKGMFETPMEKIMVSSLRAKKRPCMASSRYVLAEFGYGTDIYSMHESLDSLLKGGYLPIIAHVERYPQICQNWEFLREIVNMGAFLQVNAGSVVGVNGRTAKKFCRKLMKQDLLQFVGTDAHRIDVRRPMLSPCVDYVVRKMGKEYAKKIFIENPKKIVTRSE